MVCFALLHAPIMVPSASYWLTIKIASVPCAENTLAVAAAVASASDSAEIAVPAFIKAKSDTTAFPLRL